MKQLSSDWAKQTIALLVFIAASVIPLYCQEPSNSQRAQALQSSAEQSKEELTQANAIPAGEANRQVGSGQTSAQGPASQSYTFPTKRERFNRYVKTTVGPVGLAGSAFSAGVDQWRDNPEEWEQTLSGYGKRYASSFGRNAIQQTVTYGLDSALRLDTGFTRSTRKGFFPRMTDALLENVTSRTRAGKRVISVPRFSGAYAGGIIATEAWYPSRYGYKDGLRIGTRTLISGFGINLIREFIINW